MTGGLTVRSATADGRSVYLLAVVNLSRPVLVSGTVSCFRTLVMSLTHDVPDPCSSEMSLILYLTLGNVHEMSLILYLNLGNFPFPCSSECPFYLILGNVPDPCFLKCPLYIILGNVPDPCSSEMSLIHGSSERKCP
jgi:hypothetical protein